MAQPRAGRVDPGSPGMVSIILSDTLVHYTIRPEKKGAAAGILHDDQGMSIDPVAVYAAVVATGALGWQVYQSRSEWKGKLAERKGSLEVHLSTEWRADDNKFLCAIFVNRNNYSVRLDLFEIGTEATGGNKLGRRTYTCAMMPAKKGGLAAEVAAHDSLRIVWHAQELGKLLRDIPFRPGYAVTVAVINSLGHEYSAFTDIEDSRRFYLPYEVPEPVTPQAGT